jgi:hypothetical protein
VLAGNYDSGEYELSYHRDEMTLIGQPGRFDLESLRMSWERLIRGKIQLGANASYGTVEMLDSSVDVFDIELAGSYILSNKLSISLSYNHNFQTEVFVMNGDLDLTRNIITLSINWSYR